MKKVIYIVGPTATGKTKLSLFLAKSLNGEIISADSMQVYKDLNIISAKLKKKDMQGIKHHLISFLNNDQDFSVAEFKKKAKEHISEIHNKGKLPIVCGGTGLYINSLLKEINFNNCGKDDKIRQKYINILNNTSKDNLYNILKEKDEEYARNIHKNNTIKIIRALEVIEITKMKMSKYQKISMLNKSEYNNFIIGLNFKERKILYEIINNRVDEMVKQGIIKEVELLYKKNNLKIIKNAIGYKEFLPFLNDKKDYNSCIEDVKISTRHYAKRQITWFKKTENVNWLYIEDYKSQEQLYNKALNMCKNFLNMEYNEENKIF